MYKEITVEYENKDYPVKVEFVETADTAIDTGWIIRHKDTMILVVNYGTLTIWVGESRYSVTSGQGVLINSDIGYRVTVDKRESLSFYRLLFSTEFILPKELKNSLADKYYLPVSDDKRLRCIVLDENNLRDESALDKINTIIAINHTKKLGYEMLTKGYICLLWVAFLELAS